MSLNDELCKKYINPKKTLLQLPSAKKHFCNIARKNKAIISVWEHKVTNIRQATASCMLHNFTSLRIFSFSSNAVRWRCNIGHFQLVPYWKLLRHDSTSLRELFFSAIVCVILFKVILLCRYLRCRNVFWERFVHNIFGRKLACSIDWKV